MTFLGTKKAKPQQGKSRRMSLFWARNFKAAALTDVRAFCYIVGAALDKHDYKVLEYESIFFDKTGNFLVFKKLK